MSDVTDLFPISWPAEDRQTAIFLTGVNAETFERADEPTADEHGHIISAAVLRRRPVDPTLVPVRVRVAHGVSAETAVTMLRKMADMLERNPGFLSERPGAALRRLPGGETAKKQLTAEGIRHAASSLSGEERKRLLAMMDEIRMEIADQTPPQAPPQTGWSAPSDDTR
jgi:hypothetical protein